MSPETEAAGTHAQAMQKLRRHVAGKIATELNKRLCAAAPDWNASASLSAWDVLDAVRMWHEEMAAEFGKSCILSGRVPK